MSNEINQAGDQSLLSASQSLQSMEYIEDMGLKLLNAIRTYRQHKCYEIQDVRNENEVLRNQLREILNRQGDALFTDKIKDEIGPIIKRYSDNVVVSDGALSSEVDSNEWREQRLSIEANKKVEKLEKPKIMEEKDQNFMHFWQSLLDEGTSNEQRTASDRKKLKILEKDCLLLRKKLEVSQNKQEELQSNNYLIQIKFEELEAEVFRLNGQIRARDIMIKDLEKAMVKVQIDCDQKHAQLLHLQDRQNDFPKDAILNEIKLLIAEEMQCAICTDFLKKAVTLGCSHTFCKTCLEHLTEQLCPICRQVITFEVATPVIDSLLQKIAERYPGYKIV